MKNKQWTFALAASITLHAGALWSGWQWEARYGKEQKTADLSDKIVPKEPRIFIPVEIHHLYSEKPNPHFFKASPPPDLLPGDMGWMKKISPVALVVDEVTYASFIRDLIQERLPPQSGIQEEVAVRVVFTLNAKGEIVQLEIPPDSRAADERLNRAVLEAVRRAAVHFPPFPPAVAKPTQRFSFLLLFFPPS